MSKLLCKSIESLPPASENDDLSPSLEISCADYNNVFAHEIGTSDPARFLLPSPKRKRISPLKTKPECTNKRRKPKRWTPREVDTLRAAVKEVGEGNWKLIWESHIDIFARRTTVDLKDKWRNIKKYGGK